MRYLGHLLTRQITIISAMKLANMAISNVLDSMTTDFGLATIHPTIFPKTKPGKSNLQRKKRDIGIIGGNFFIKPL